MADTTHLQLPLLAAAQAQKHVTHNDALLRLDAVVQLSVKDRNLTSPPASPSDGDRYIPASGATGDWSGWDLNIAWYVDGVWTKLVPREGWRIWIDDEDVLLVHNGTGWVKLPAAIGTWQVLAASAAAVSHSGDLVETALATVTVPAGAMGANGILRVTSLWTVTNSGNIKRTRIRLGGATGSAFLNLSHTTTASAQVVNMISNRGAEDSQVGHQSNNATSFAKHGGSVTTTAVDTSVARDLVFTAQLTDSTETITLEQYSVELLYRA